uniref:Uncharacterized protein n=1 Tax=Rhipicephalus pulchellus TaxID=72859 RepID=L7LZU4_RHIPC
MYFFLFLTVHILIFLSSLSFSLYLLLSVLLSLVSTSFSCLLHSIYFSHYPCLSMYLCLFMSLFPLFLCIFLFLFHSIAFSPFLSIFYLFLLFPCSFRLTLALAVHGSRPCPINVAHTHLRYFALHCKENEEHLCQLMIVIVFNDGVQVMDSLNSFAVRGSYCCDFCARWHWSFLLTVSAQTDTSPFCKCMQKKINYHKMY